MSALKKKYALSRNAEDPKTINLVMNYATRWNLTYEMLQKVCMYQFVIWVILSDESVTPHRQAVHLELKD